MRRSAGRPAAAPSPACAPRRISPRPARRCHAEGRQSPEEGKGPGQRHEPRAEAVLDGVHRPAEPLAVLSALAEAHGERYLGKLGGHAEYGRQPEPEERARPRRGLSPAPRPRCSRCRPCPPARRRRPARASPRPSPRLRARKRRPASGASPPESAGAAQSRSGRSGICPHPRAAQPWARPRAPPTRRI